jgi:hypothetical protein
VGWSCGFQDSITVQVLTFTLGSNSLCSVLAIWNQLPLVLGVDVGCDAGLWLVKICAPARCGLRLFVFTSGRLQGDLNSRRCGVGCLGNLFDE